MKKLDSILVCALVLLATASAQASDVLVLDDGLENKNSMAWPMLPGESLNALAAKFYPDNKVMQRHFVNKTLQLNAEVMPKLNPAANFKLATAVFVPTLKSLSLGAGHYQAAHKKPAEKSLQMSYNIKSAMESVPKSLLQEYENLVIRNTFLKQELAKLNEKLVFLQTKLNHLKLILDKTLTVSEKKVFKNLSETPVNKKAIEAKPIVDAAPAESALSKVSDLLFSPAAKMIWLLALGLGVIGLLISFLLKKYREKLFNKISFQAMQSNSVSNFDKTLDDKKPEVTFPVMSTPLGADTMVGEQNTSAILDEAKTMVAKGEPNEAIEHLKWAIRAKPKKAINLWLYMLQIFREQNLKDDFENYAKAMHQTFNVMTPMWEEKVLPMVVAQSLEEFSHIIEKLAATWPSEAASVYLRSLITDNRDGERTGFGKAVLDEILLLIMVLESRL